MLPDADCRATAFYPERDLPDFQRDLAGKELVVDVTTGGYLIRLINAGNEFRPTPAISFLLRIDPRNYGYDGDGQAGTRAEIDRLWGA